MDYWKLLSWDGWMPLVNYNYLAWNPKVMEMCYMLQWGCSLISTRLDCSIIPRHFSKFSCIFHGQMGFKFLTFLWFLWCFRCPMVSTWQPGQIDSVRLGWGSRKMPCCFLFRKVRLAVPCVFAVKLCRLVDRRRRVRVPMSDQSVGSFKRR